MTVSDGRELVTVISQTVDQLYAPSVCQMTVETPAILLMTVIPQTLSRFLLANAGVLTVISQTAAHKPLFLRAMTMCLPNDGDS